jgi:hypothetical protein
MSNGITRQVMALQHIAAFSAALRGHELSAWQTGQGFALAHCVRCGAELRVYFPVLEPEMDGAALDRECDQYAAAEKVA